MHGPQHSPRQEDRLKQPAVNGAAPLMGKRVTLRKGLKGALGCVDDTGTTKNGELKCKLNVEHARSVLWFACPGAECIAGDFDLSEALANAVAGRRKVATGELRCQGTRKRGDREVVACRTLLRY